MSESELVKDIIDGAANGYGVKNNLVFDGTTKQFRPSGYSRNPDSSLSVGPKDVDFSAIGGF